MTEIPHREPILLRMEDEIAIPGHIRDYFKSNGPARSAWQDTRRVAPERLLKCWRCDKEIYQGKVGNGAYSTPILVEGEWINVFVCRECNFLRETNLCLKMTTTEEVEGLEICVSLLEDPAKLWDVSETGFYKALPLSDVHQGVIYSRVGNLCGSKMLDYYQKHHPEGKRTSSVTLRRMLIGKERNLNPSARPSVTGDAVVCKDMDRLVAFRGMLAELLTPEAASKYVYPERVYRPRMLNAVTSLHFVHRFFMYGLRDVVAIVGADLTVPRYRRWVYGHNQNRHLPEDDALRWWAANLTMAYAPYAIMRRWEGSHGRIQKDVKRLYGRLAETLVSYGSDLDPTTPAEYVREVGRRIFSWGHAGEKRSTFIQSAEDSAERVASQDHQDGEVISADVQGTWLDKTVKETMERVPFKDLPKEVQENLRREGMEY